MTPEQSTLAALIAEHAAADVAAETPDWNAIAGKLNALTIERRRTGTVSMAETLQVLAAAGHSVDDVLTAIQVTPTGAAGISKLAAVGLHYDHPITQALLTERVSAGAISQAVADTLTRLSVWQVSPAIDAGLSTVTGQQCSDAWAAHLTDQLQSGRNAAINDTLDVVAAAVRADNSISLADAQQLVSDELAARWV